MKVKIGSTDVTDLIFIADPASTVGKGKTGLSAAAIKAGYTRVETDNDVVAVDGSSSLSDITLTAAHTDWGFEEVDGTLQPGLYRIDLPDAVFASGARQAVLYVMINTDSASPSIVRYDLVGYDETDGVRLGLTALPNAAADAAGGLPISDAGGLDMDDLKGDVTAVRVKTDSLTFSVAGEVDANVHSVNNVEVSGTGATGDPWGPAA